jgi:transmembrane sensor
MPRHDDLADREAVAWAVRVGDPAFDDWPAFQAWLEADPANAARYHACADAVAAAKEVPAGAAERPVRRRWPLWGGAVAASLALAIGYAAIERPETSYAVETAPGATRVMQMADGSVATLAGATRLVFDRTAPRRVTLERGEALFVVRHDARDPFTVTVGDATLVDVGTTFDATRSGGTLQLAVSAGAVDYVGGGLRARIVAGQALRVTGDTAERSAVDPAAVGGWRTGTFSYDGAPLSEVASDLARATGVSVTVAPALRDRPVRGTLALGERRGNLAPLAALLGVEVRRTAAGWAIDPAR